MSERKEIRGPRPHVDADRDAAFADDELALLDALLDAEQVPAPAERIPGRGARVAPLAPAQRRLWFLHQLDPASTAYTIAGGLLLRGALDTRALEGALAEVIARHGALRTTFESEQGKPRQIVHDSVPFAVERARAADSGEAARFGAALARRSWDLSRPPLVRATLIEIGDHEHALIVTMHHLVADGASLSILFREITTLYEAFSAHKTSPLPALPIQFADVACYEDEAPGGSSLETSLGWWKEALAGAPERLDLPYDRPPAAGPSYRGARHHFTIPGDCLRALDALARGEKATRFMALVAAFQALLGRYSGQDDVLIGVPVAGRDRPETENLIGFFVNTIVLRADLSDDATFRTLLGRVRRMALGAYAHRDLPFDRLVEALRPERAAGHGPLFQVMAAEEEMPLGDLALSGLTVTPLEIPSETSQFDLTFSFAQDKDGGSTAAFDYSTDLFDAGTIVRMADHFRVLLQSIVAKPGAKLSTLPLMTEEEERGLLFEWSASGRARPQSSHEVDTDPTEIGEVGGSPSHDRGEAALASPSPIEISPSLDHRAATLARPSLLATFEAQAARAPQAEALVFEGGTLSFRTLQDRARALARHLVSLGVGPEVRVGVSLTRSPEAVVALLGILEAGGVYVPIDPAWPEPRRAFVLDDAKAAVHITSGGIAREGTSTHVPASRDLLRVDALRGSGGSSLAWIVYTSGTTGTPRGVGVPHRAASAHFAAVRQIYGLGPADRTLLTGSLAFDASIVGSSRVDLQACKLEYSIVSPK